ncbi:MAG TPA: hypothetical protein VLJ76_08910 [Gaiellaceae bacterium]|nr:hypothetical protein [Gaiellaceae bacterium]
MSDWAADFEREQSRYDDGAARLPGLDDRDDRQRQLTRMGNAATGAGLASLMDGRRDDAAGWLARAADCYRESYPDAPPGSWGRPIGAIKARLLAGDKLGAEDAARWTLAEGATEAGSPIGRYAAALALLALGDDARAEAVAQTLTGRDDFPDEVALALAGLAAGDRTAYQQAVADVLRSFETRSDYLEDIAVADTVIVLQALAADRGLAAELSSALLP